MLKKRKHILTENENQKVENDVFIPILFTSRGARSIKTSRVINKIENKIIIKQSQERQVVIIEWQEWQYILILTRITHLSCQILQRKTNEERAINMLVYPITLNVSTTTYMHT